ncbi:MAG: hypothetical protein EI684_18565 [Candidatus Viridilinea halotolerans]|uniref:O-antigen ligase-related domain-containing protein n=1 Tax=Candidatus Viridilinea halotolerans TaxID=2491704 RepID=A0A426TT78_9CHLR|nr:MAG: hypothetical protein EI684_18565 [Candidatus Viridilinea halotolerans]
MQGGEEAEQAQQKVPGHRASHSSGGADFSRRSDLPTEVGTTTLKLKASFWNFPLLSHSSWFLPTLLFLAAALWGVWIAGERGPALRELRWMVIEPLLIIGLAGIMARWHAAHVIADGRTGDLPRPASRVSPPASRLPHPPPYWHRLLQAWLLGGCIAALVALLQLVGLNLVPLFGIKAGFSADSFFVEGVQRVSGLYGHPNNLGLAMGRYWPLAAALAYAAWQQAGMRHAWPYFVATGLCMAALLASFSRGAYLGALVAAFVLAAMLLPTTRWRDRRLWWAGGATLGAGLLIISLSVILGIERLNPFGASGGIRMQTWASALAMLRDHPLGVGLDQFGRLYPSYIAPELRATNEINTAHPHNLLLDIALRMGPLGLIAFAWLLANFYRRSVPQNAILVGAAAAMSASLAHGLVDQFYFWPDLALSFWLLVALVVGRTDLSPTDY